MYSKSRFSSKMVIVGVLGCLGCLVAALSLGIINKDLMSSVPLVFVSFFFGLLIYANWN